MLCLRRGVAGLLCTGLGLRAFQCELLIAGIHFGPFTGEVLTPRIGLGALARQLLDASLGGRAVPGELSRLRFEVRTLTRQQLARALGLDAGLLRGNAR